MTTLIKFPHSRIFLIAMLLMTLSACGGSSGARPDRIVLVNASISGDLPPPGSGSGSGQGNGDGGQGSADGNGNNGGSGGNPGNGNGGNDGNDPGDGSGNGNGNGNGNTDPPPPVDDTPRPPSSPALSVACAVENCAAASASWYAGRGTGVWRYRNTGASDIVLPMDVGGLNSASVVSVIFTNEDSQPRPLPAGIRVPVPVVRPATANRSLLPCALQEGSWIQRGQYTDTSGATPRTVAYSFCTDKLRSVLAHDGRAIDFWVEQGEQANGRITASLVESLAQRFALDAAANVYDTVTAITGAPWGSHQNNLYISDTGNGAPAALPLNIVFVNTLTERFAPGNHLAQLNPDNLRIKSQFDGSDISARKLSIFIDSSALYTDPAFLLNNDDGSTSLNETAATEYLKSELARELTRLAVFYQRGLKVSARYTLPPWLEDMVATMMQYTVDSKLGSHTGADGRRATWQGVARPLERWFQGIPDCDVLLRPAMAPAEGSCASDSSSVAFSVYLMNQYGIGLLNRLLAVELVTGDVDYVALLDRRIQQSGGPGFSASLWRHGSSLALLGRDPLPPRFGLPMFADAAYSYPAQNLATLNRVAQLPVASADIASSIAAYGHVAMRRNVSGGNYRESVVVPPGVSVTLVIQ